MAKALRMGRNLGRPGRQNADKGAQGYFGRVRASVEGIHAIGAAFEAYVDPQTGEIVPARQRGWAEQAMTSGSAAETDAGSVTLPAEAGSRMARVWNPFVRLFHWLLVLLFAAAYLTGDALDRAHELLGYAIIALLVARIAWGVVGSEHARFRDFVFDPATVSAYARDSIAGRARRYLGHNPLGGVMVLLLITGLLVNAGTGWWMTVAGESHFVEEVHEVLANGMLVLIALHVEGVLFSSLAHGENLVRGMIKGLKRAE